MYIFLFLLSSLLYAPGNGIVFQETNLSSALDRAGKEDKLVFVDTYATWCKPCKQMDVVFEDARLGDFFNAHFVNVKINMDKREGQKLQKQYEIVFLPTLLVLNADGSIMVKIDRLLSAGELLEIGTSIRNNKDQANNRNALSDNPFGLQGAEPATVNEEDMITEDNAPVVYVYDERASSGRPHIMYHEAYLHLQLMDGQHQKVVKKYLSTQQDWTTEKNVRFIFDFVNDTRTKEFDFIIQNKARFYEIIGKDRVDQSLRILIYQQLYNGIPRPTFEESLELFALLDHQKSEQEAYTYFLNRLAEKGETRKYISLASTYLKSVNPYDHAMIYRFVTAQLGQKYSQQDLVYFMKLTDTAISLNDQNVSYIILKAQLLYLQSERAGALSYCERAEKLAISKGEDVRKIRALKYKIMSL